MTASSALFRLLLEEMHLKVCELTLPLPSAAAFPDMGLRLRLFGPDAPFQETLPPLETPSDGRMYAYLLRDRYLCRYFLGTGPEKLGQIWLVGPYLVEEPTTRSISLMCEKLKLPPQYQDFFRSYYKMLPKLRDENLTEALFRTHLSVSCGPAGFVLTPWEMESKEQAPLAGYHRESSPDLREYLERTYVLERLLMNCVAQGNYSGAISAYTRLKACGKEARTMNSLRDGKNSLLLFNTLCRLAAYEGGVHPCDLDDWTREFAMQIESAVDEQELKQIQGAALKKFCALAHAAGENRYSPVISKVLDYVSGAFPTTISLKEVAVKFGINPSYLSTLFKREVGESFTQYVTRRRLEFAGDLLARTDLPVGTVATECGIPDNNYFARVFKAHTGMQPLQYRAVHQPLHKSEEAAGTDKP